MQEREQHKMKKIMVLAFFGIVYACSGKPKSDLKLDEKATEDCINSYETMQKYRCGVLTVRAFVGARDICFETVEIDCEWLPVYYIDGKEVDKLEICDILESCKIYK